jgi:SAM-dependent methyltransferase
MNVLYWGVTILYSAFVLVFAFSFLLTLFIKVPFVPSKNIVAKKLIEEADIKDGQKIYDLGCGDGRLLIEASKNKKVKAIGYEISPMAYILGKINTWFKRSKAEVKFKNFFHQNLKDANVIFLYLLPEILPAVGDKIKEECAKGTRIISNTFKLPNLEPIKVIAKNPQAGLPTIYVYEV